ncbi:MAG: hypothetical protein ACKOXB_00940 [Flavobacteriales bacterium]
MKTVYNLKDDSRRIKLIQETSLDSKSIYGYKIIDNLLFGSKDWFKAIEIGKISTYNVQGIISKLIEAGHNDYPEFELENGDGKFLWTRYGNSKLYVVGKKVEVIFIEQKFKRGGESRCIIQINIE